MSKNIHEGKKLTRFLKKNGYTIIKLSKKLHLSRATFYSKLKLKKLPQEFVQAVANATSQPSLPLILQGKDTPKKQKKHNKEIISHYISTLERHIELLDASTHSFLRIIKRQNRSKKNMF